MGWVKLHRELLEWEWYTDSHMVHLFTHLLLTANFEPNKWRGVTILRGQTIIGREKLSAETGISQQTIRTCLERLKSTNEITIKTTNKFSIVTICNYELYQDDKPEINQQINQQTNQQLTNSQPTTNHTLRIKEVKEVKNEEALAKKRFIKPTVELIREYCEKRKNGINAEYFFDHYEANGWLRGRGIPVKDWEACVRTWEKNGVNKPKMNGHEIDKGNQSHLHPAGYNRKGNDGAARL